MCLDRLLGKAAEHFSGIYHHNLLKNKDFKLIVMEIVLQ